MKAKLLKDSDGALKCIEKLAGSKSKPISKSTKRKIELAAKIAQEKIEYDNNVYVQSATDASDIRLGGRALIKKI